ncbi:2-isopropylmalate synthase [Neptuniibacter sp. CAU 1671]|uniref:2-isopropylmalate synthase n=1 Tax=Neptuniibacter sp. CAU 1671 TaxID=3032593 RepID=UPI0023DBF946|nr:2-isopropylmalate synthase [Neptuniibacter sp. CAU 1671]MDF2182854.1 2-isopropylmalate synthase [Neptuniibacter sp. CAU 1671]
MLSNPATKYSAFAPVKLENRQWPNRTIEHPPIWMSTDLRDGNQSLIDPMSVETKLRFFEMLVEIGFKEIEVAFPAASDTDFNFVRRLIEENRIPDDVTIEVLTQAREDLIKRTVESLVGARRAIVHMYNPTAPDFRRIVYNTDVAGVKAIAEQGTRWVKQYTAQYPETEWVFQYSPEVFSGTELPVAKEVCDAVSAIWQPTPERKMIINLPATVEMSTPNIYADQIEWMHRNLARRESILISVHPHNDRGTAVAAAELAVMAGADRVEGCLFGNGERTGNVDIVTLALNLYTQGVHPGLDFSRIEQIRRTVEECNQIPVHPRHPYAGELVFTAFSGSHQDAIKKGFAQRDPEGIWEVPYLPIDPADLNRGYEAVVRVNSQSGKGGVSFLLQQQYGLELPRRLQIEFSRVVKNFTDAKGQEATSADILALFEQTYIKASGAYDFTDADLTTHSHGDKGATEVEIRYQDNGQQRTVNGIGNGTIDAAIKALGQPVQVIDYHEHAIGSGAAVEAACYIEMQIDGGPAIFGVGIDRNIVSAAIKALFTGLNRSQSVQEAERQAS